MDLYERERLRDQVATLETALAECRRRCETLAAANVSLMLDFEALQKQLEAARMALKAK